MSKKVQLLIQTSGEEGSIAGGTFNVVNDDGTLGHSGLNFTQLLDQIGQDPDLRDIKNVEVIFP